MKTGLQIQEEIYAKVTALSKEKDSLEGIDFLEIKISLEDFNTYMKDINTRPHFPHIGVKKYMVIETPFGVKVRISPYKIYHASDSKIR